MEVQIAAAVCADKQAGEHIVFSVAGTAFAHLSTLLLYLLKHGTFNNGFVNILEHYPIFRVVMNPVSYTHLVHQSKKADTPDAE